MSKQAITCILFSLLSSAALLVGGVSGDNGDDAAAAGAGTRRKASGTVRVYVFAGQSNMEGHGEIDMTDEYGNQKNGTLLYQLQDPRTKEEFQILWDEEKNDFRTLTNVKVWFNEAGDEQLGFNGSKIPGENGVDYSAGDLTVGFGTGGTKKGQFFGPELGFGFNVDIPKGDKVLIFKTAWGGKDIAQDFRPPSSAGTFDPYCRLPDCNPYVVGHYYRTMMDDVKKLLKPGVVSEIYPDLEGMPVDIAGFGWFHGWNDGCSVNYTAAYETNFVHLVQDLRRAWKKPTLPVSLGISGFFGWRDNGAGRTPPDCWDGPNATKVDCHCDNFDRDCRRIDIMLSQIGAANLTRHPELKCCIEAVETRNFWRDVEYSPMDQVYHFNHNAETHYLIGKAIAEGMNRAQLESTRQNMEQHQTIS